MKRLLFIEKQKVVAVSFIKEIFVGTHIFYLFVHKYFELLYVYLTSASQDVRRFSLLLPKLTLYKIKEIEKEMEKKHKSIN